MATEARSPREPACNGQPAPTGGVPVSLPSCALLAALVIGAAPPTPHADGVYVVLRDGRAKKDVLPLKRGESLVVHRHRYQARDEATPPRFVVVRPTPDVRIDLEGKPRPIKTGEEVVGINLKLRPKAGQ